MPHRLTHAPHRNMYSTSCGLCVVHPVASSEMNSFERRKNPEYYSDLTLAFSYLVIIFPLRNVSFHCDLVCLWARRMLVHSVSFPHRCTIWVHCTLSRQKSRWADLDIKLRRGKCKIVSVVMYSKSKQLQEKKNVILDLLDLFNFKTHSVQSQQVVSCTPALGVLKMYRHHRNRHLELIHWWRLLTSQ